jgi:hypothetical protein
MDREKRGRRAVPRTVPVQLMRYRILRMSLTVDCSQRCECVMNG